MFRSFLSDVRSRVLDLLDWLHALFERAPALPPVVYEDKNGEQWVRPPEWLDAEYPDEGQHDVWKRDMRIFLYRARLGIEEHGLDVSRIGCGRGMESAPALWPVGQQLAEASRRLGYLRLARAAAAGLDFSEEDLLDIHAEHERRVAEEAERRYDVTAATAKHWDPARGTFEATPVDETVRLLTLGPPDAHAACAPLVPFQRAGTVSARNFIRVVK